MTSDYKVRLRPLEREDLRFVHQLDNNASVMRYWFEEPYEAFVEPLYLFSYYLGSSIAGTLGGVFWHSYGWNGVGGFIALMLVLAILVGTRLHHRLHA
ncbi:spermidine N1-acetyltransferase [Salmonella enterica subsp. enterica serovar Typhi]|nr:spermidine N1-acetyltransferase [Salmonella enterica subsp. enterica serovar Typhi]